MQTAKSATVKHDGAPEAIINPAMPVQRIASVDVYRGFVMVLMMAELLSFTSVSNALPGNSFWAFLSFHQSHVEWSWIALHDMIQPSFSFLVGVALPFSISSRQNKGGNKSSLIKHAIIRSLILICLGIFLRSRYSNQTYFTFEDTLTQIGLGYTFLVLLGLSSKRIQLVLLCILLAGYWLAFALYPVPTGLSFADTGVPDNWQYNFHGFAAHWNKNTNLAWAFDRWFLNLFPRESPFLFNEGGYATLSFIPTLGTMILGLMAGNVLKSPKPPREKVKNFIITGICLVVLGVLLHVAGINPVVKRIWTPAWTIFSGGLCFLFLAFFYGVVDVAHKKRWAFIFMFIGMNSIAAYVMADGGFSTYISQALTIHLGKNYSMIFGEPSSTLVKGGLILSLEWLVLYWMYKRKIFIKL